MKLNVLSLVSIFILTCFQLLGPGYRRLGLSRGAGAASSLLLLALTAFPVKLGLVEFDIPSVLLPAYTLVRLKGSHCSTKAPILSLVGGISGWLLTLAFPSFFEQGILLALPVLFACAAFGMDAPGCALAVCLSPFVYGVIHWVEDWYIFGMNDVQLTPDPVSGAQAFGLLLLLLFLSVKCHISSIRRGFA